MKPLLAYLLTALILTGCHSTVVAKRCVPGELVAASYERRSGPLTDAEMQMARNAWKYFEVNYQPDTGFVNAVDGYPSTTMWDTASYIAALVAAHELGIVNAEVFHGRLTKLIDTFNKLAFFQDEAPNKVYNAKTMEKADYANKPGEIGFSALDLGRLLIWLKIVKERYPQHADGIDRFVLRWKFDNMVDRDGVMYGAAFTKDRKVQYLQEGRLGYEEYAAKGFQLWGIATERAAQAEPYETIPLYCVEVPYDSRDPRKYYQHNYVVSESYVLDGVELGWDLAEDRSGNDRQFSHPWMADFAHRVYQAQENRFHHTGILTARSEHQLDQEPYFVYDTVYTDGYAWNTITEKGDYVPQFAAVSLKAALGMWVLWKSDYTDRLFDAIAKQAVPDKGYYEGILESGKGPIRTFTANNNGIMLEALLFKVQGKLLKWGPDRNGLWEKQFTNPYGTEVRTRFTFERERSGQIGCTDREGRKTPC